MNKELIVVTFLLCFVIQRNAAQRFLPPIACPEYFQYQTYENQAIGKVTLPNISPGSTKLDIEFSQQQSLQTTYYGRVSLYQDQDTTINNIHSGLPISYRVDFPMPEVPPKLTKISVNDNLICSTAPYRAPNTMIRLQHTLETSTRNVVIQRPLGGGGIFGQTDTFVPDSYRPILPPIRTTPRPQIVQTQPPPPPTPRPQPVQTTTVRNIPTVRTGDVNAICGQEGSIVTPLIVGGSIVARGQFPWLTPIYQKLAAGSKFICGGSLISARTVITAAHCFTLTSLRADQILVYVGRYKLDSFREDGFKTRELSNLIINPEYDANIYPDADIALLQLDSAVVFTQFIRPICLWSNPTAIEGQVGFIAGWGSDENGNEVSPIPKMAKANIVSEAECLRSDGFSGLTSARTICAGNRDGTGPCKGDSGGGLMIQQNGRWLLRGIVSAGQSQNRQCDLHQFVIYCDLAKHITWIQGNIVN